MSDFIFQVPWWLIAVLLGDGAVMLVLGNRRLNTPLRTLGLALVLLGLLWMLVSYFVDTDLEKVDSHTRDLVRRVVAQDEPGIRQWLHPQATAGAWGPEEIVRGAVHYARTFGLTGARILSLTPQRRGRDITARVAVLSEQSGYPLNSVWQLDWQPTAAKQWKLRVITPLQIGGEGREEVEHRYLDQPVGK